MKLTSIFFASVAASEIVPFGFTDCWTTFKRELKKCDRLNEPEDQLMCLFELFKSSSMCLLESLCDRFDEGNDCTAEPTAEAQCVKEALADSILFAKDQDWRTVDFETAFSAVEEKTYTVVFHLYAVFWVTR